MLQFAVTNIANVGKEIVTSDDREQIKEMLESLETHPSAKEVMDLVDKGKE